MIRSAFSMIFTLAACTSTSAIMPTKLDVPSAYALVWSDEFDQDGLPDPTRWTYDTYRNADGWWNDEAQYYAAGQLENSRIENGNLIIEARQDPDRIAGFPDNGGQVFSSARLLTKGLAAWQYGYFEIRAKLPCGRGLWPAIWTLPEERSRWPDDGEIDIMEYVGWSANQFHATVHTKDNNHVTGSDFGESFTSDTACGAFHTHSLLWTEDALTVAVDGTPYFHYPKAGKGYGAWPFDQPHHLILNLAIGGWGGRQGIDPNAFPAQMVVDYVRIYQKADAS